MYNVVEQSKHGDWNPGLFAEQPIFSHVGENVRSMIFFKSKSFAASKHQLLANNMMFLRKSYKLRGNVHNSRKH